MNGGVLKMTKLHWWGSFHEKKIKATIKKKQELRQGNLREYLVDQELIEVRRQHEADQGHPAAVDHLHQTEAVQQLPAGVHQTRVVRRRPIEADQRHQTKTEQQIIKMTLHFQAVWDTGAVLLVTC